MTGGDVNAHTRELSTGGKEKIDAKIDMCVSMSSPANTVTHNPDCILSGTTSGFLNWVKGLSGTSDYWWALYAALLGWSYCWSRETGQVHCMRREPGRWESRDTHQVRISRHHGLLLTVKSLETKRPIGL